MSPLRLFAYGTLQVPEVLHALVGRRWPGEPALLEGYARYRLGGKPYPAIVADALGSVSGVLYSGLTEQDLELLDSYEGELYERRELHVRASGASFATYSYVLCEQHRARLSSETWDLARFLREHLASYLQLIASTRRAP